MADVAKEIAKLEKEIGVYQKQVSPRLYACHAFSLTLLCLA
jgi:hypothetical protein